jgi:hypothetical protein
MELQKTRVELNTIRAELNATSAKLDEARARPQGRRMSVVDDVLTNEVIAVKKENAALKANLASVQEDLKDFRSSSNAKVLSLQKEIEMLR